MPGQTVQTQIRLLLEEQSDQGLHCTVCHSVCIVWTHYSIVEPHSSNIRVITTNVLGVRIFRKFTVDCVLHAKRNPSFSRLHVHHLFFFLRHQWSSIKVHFTVCHFCLYLLTY